MSFDPTPAQNAIRESTESSILISAPAGCGKTEAIALRVEGLIARQQVTAPRQVLALTYSNRATENLRERCYSRLRTGSQRERVVIQNFHGFAMRVLAAHCRLVGINDWPLTYPTNDVIGSWLNATKFSNRFGVRDAIYEDLRLVKQTAMEDADVVSHLQHPVAIEFEKWRQSSRILTYDDVIRYADILLGREGVANLYQQRFPFVMLDEFQDTTPQQLRIATRVAPTGVTFAGDVGQGIYRFTGAAPDEIEKFAEQNTTQKFLLEESHRSSPSVLDSYNALANVARTRTLRCARPHAWPGSGISAGVTFETWEDEASWVCQLAHFLNTKSPAARIGILSPNANRRRRIDEQLDLTQLPHYRWDAPLHDPVVAPVLKRILLLLSEMGEACLERDDFDVRTLIPDTRFHDAEAARNYESGLQWIVSGLMESTPQELLSALKVGKRDSLLTEPGIHQLTAHTGKGLQFDWVIIPGMEEGNMPFYGTETRGEERDQARVLSVMISRARFGVIFCHSKMFLAATGREMRQPFSRYGSMLGNVKNLDALRAWLIKLDWSAVNTMIG